MLTPNRPVTIDEYACLMTTTLMGTKRPVWKRNYQTSFVWFDYITGYISLLFQQSSNATDLHLDNGKSNTA